MSGSTVTVDTSLDGSVQIKAQGVLNAENATELRHVLVRIIRHIRPPRLILDLREAAAVDSINVGVLAAAYALGEDDGVAVFLDNCTAELAGRLAGTGVAGHRLLHVASGAGRPPTFERLTATAPAAA